MNGPHRPCTYRMGVVGDRCRHWGEESGKKSTVVGDQRQTGVEEVDSVETEACKSRKFERWRAASV